MTSAAIFALSAVSGLDLASYRPEHVAERVRRALDRERAGDVAELARVLRSDVDARRRFRRSVAISVSGLFRDPAQFELLERELLPPLVARGRRLTVWSAGCADGSELTSVGLLLDRLGALERAVLLGSDVLEENLEVARRGDYGDVDVPASVRSRMRWERRDIVREGPPAGRWRLILFRNVAIYLSSESKRGLLARMADALALDGVLLLGRSEWIVAPADLGLERAGPHAYRKVAA